ncbi:ParB N-terminal domain-containing protein [Picosynechococcus sp. NKBG15041c]|uniref:ParB/RepB/Spo0J family partition protein n=1 Tax=Picosynechococcus sp. NKBG15041c TaxID=1407650 RepID=UPI00040D097E|nr:ParB N-terminal domain-containing protein [Picosynechococcus sp. NKBG15041c]
MARKKPILDLDRLNQRAAETFTAEKNYEKEVNQNLKLLLFEDILDRPGGDARPLKDAHVQALAESILVLGLITPLTVDRHGHLLAGGHRRAALHQIKLAYPEQYAALFPEGIPVRVVDIDAATDAVDALQIEIEENTQRKNFTTTEIKEAAQKLEQAGYKRLRGRPKAGEKSLKRELAKVFRLSEDRIQRILNETTQKGRCAPTFSPEQAIATVEKWSQTLASSEDKALVPIKIQLQSLLATLRELQSQHR